MNEFSVALYHKIGLLFGSTEASLHSLAGKRPALLSGDLAEWLGTLAATCERDGLNLSAEAATRIAKEFREGHRDPADLGIKIGEMTKLITAEMDSHLFLWVPPQRSKFYSKRAHDIAGPQWCSRFVSTIPEIEEAAKCYAVGRYTAAAFHLMRATEKGTKALV